MECPRCLCKMDTDDALVTHVAFFSGRATYVSGFRCPECSECFVPVAGEAVPLEEYEVFQGAPESILSEDEWERLAEETC